MRKRFFTLVLLLAAAGAAAATTQRRPPPPPIRIVVDDPGAQPIEVQKLDIGAAINGSTAETTVRIVFYNPNRRQLEGNLQFPLADGQQITAFALDVNGAMRPAVPVEKARGRAVFEAIERERVDPGLLEVTQGNNFKLRVYPIPPQGTRTVELRYAEPLARRGANWIYRLPLAYGKVGRFGLSVRASGSDAAPSAPGSALAFKPEQGDFVASIERERYSADSTIEVATAARSEPRVYRQVVEDKTWFVAEVPVTAARARRTVPRVIGLLWDSSGSGAARTHDAELTELDRYFAAIGNVEVRLTRLRDRAEAQQIFKVAGGNWAELRRALASTVYDGASALGAWQPQASVDQYLLFSDGMSNYGAAPFPQLARHQQLFALNSAVSADTARLAGLAERNGGQLIQVAQNAPGAAAQSLLYQDARVRDIAATGATDVEVDSNLLADGMLRLAGRMLSASGELKITLTNGGLQKEIVIALPAEGASHPRAAAVWAGFRLRRLDADFELHRAEIARLGQRFAIPTRETSLIVLEQLTDYLRYDIEPPQELAADFKKLRDAAGTRMVTSQREHFDQVLRMFEDRKTWWNMPKPKPSLQEKQDRFSPMASPAPVASMATPPPPAPAAEMRMAARAAGEAASMERKTKKSSGNAEPQIGIALKKWEADAPYIARLKAAAPDKVYAVYLDQRPDNAASSAFFLDAADILLDKGHRDLALRVLSNLAEIDLENRAVLRILGYRLIQAGEPKLSVPVFQEVLRIAEEEPQSLRDLGLAYAAAGEDQKAADTLYQVFLKPWNGRFPEIEKIVLAEFNAILARSQKRLATGQFDKRLVMNMPLDLRVVLTWDADNSDMDLYVTDQGGERCDYTNNRSHQGGAMSRDFVAGYGPEEFSLRRADPGTYKIEANYYGNRQQVLAGATTLQVKLFSGFGTPNQKEQMITLRLKERSETVFVGEFVVK
jgi:Ca-activated chloride channel family protein